MSDGRGWDGPRSEDVDGGAAIAFTTIGDAEYLASAGPQSYFSESTVQCA